MTYAQMLKRLNRGASMALGMILTSGMSASANQTAVDIIVANYDRQCQAMQAQVLPSIDADLDAPSPKGILKINDGSIYEVLIDKTGKTATVVHASFGCSNFGYPWCGMGGNCTSYLIVDDTVFEWEGGGMPQSVAGSNTVLIAKSVSGYTCKDENGDNGFGASPCYEVTVWDEELGTFWSSNSHIKFRPDLSAP
jgi:hypothetical protein